MTEIFSRINKATVIYCSFILLLCSIPSSRLRIGVRNDGAFLSLLCNLRCHSVYPFVIPYATLSYRHPGCGSGSAMTDPGSLRTSDNAVTGDCGSEPAMTGLFSRIK
jgi:hypothetical protein